MNINSLIRGHSKLLVLLHSAITSDDTTEVARLDGKINAAFNAILNYQPSSKTECLVQVKFLLDILILPEDRKGLAGQIYDKLLQMSDYSRD